MLNKVIRNQKPIRQTEAFTLLELLTAIAIIAILATITLASVSHVRDQARAVQCAANLRNLGMAFHLYANDHNGEIPPSWHSAGANRQQNWAWQIKDYVHQDPVNDAEVWDFVFDENYRCPVQPKEGTRKYSYGLNVYFELNPDFDSYKGSPTTWKTFESLPSISNTVLLGETRFTSYGDHFMAHDWSGIEAATNAIDHDRHLAKANYLFADGNVQRLSAKETFDPKNQIDKWHPEPEFGK